MAKKRPAAPTTDILPALQSARPILDHRGVEALQHLAGNRATRTLLATSIAGVRPEPEPFAPVARRSVAHDHAGAVQQVGVFRTTIQRYVEDDPDLAPGKVSDSGAIAMVSDKEVYATDAKIDEANGTLEESDARFVLERGAAFDPPNSGAWQARFGGPPALKQVKPVFKQEALGPNEAPTQPVAGDTGPVKQEKLARYQAALRDKILAIQSLKFDLQYRWTAEENKRRGLKGYFATETPASAIWPDFNGRINRLIADTMGPMWATTDAALAVFQPQGNERARLTLDQHLGLFDALAADYLAKFNNELAPEMQLADLWMTLPNDCKNAAMQLTGRDAVALNAEASEDPTVGENYAVHFPPAMKYGWATHYSTVIMKDVGDDNTDNLTFETAASISAGMQEGKSLGFFEMYGTENPIQTFEYVSWRKNLANVAQQAQVDLANAATDEARQQILDEWEADRNRIYGRLARLTPLPENDDDDL